MSSEAPVSRIVTCYKQWTFLGHWLKDDALFGPGVEWLVVNDAPGHAPPPDVSDLMARRGVRLLTVLSNMGRSRARNHGAREARGTWLDFVDGDDHPLPLDPATVLNRDCELLAGPVRLADATRTPFADASRAPIEAFDNWADLLPRFAPINVAPSALLWRREYFLALDGYDARFDGGEDLQLAYRAMTHGARLERMPCPKQCYFLRGGRMTFEPQHIYSHRRVLEYIARETADPAIRAAAERWLGKQVMYEIGAATYSAWEHRRLAFRYLAFRLRSLF